MTRVKICGVTTVADARRCVELGADAVGVNFVTGSPRRVDLERARAIVRAPSTVTRRGLEGTKFSPIALAPASTQRSAPSTVVTPQIFTCVDADADADADTLRLGLKTSPRS